MLKKKGKYMPQPISFQTVLTIATSYLVDWIEY